MYPPRVPETDLPPAEAIRAAIELARSGPATLRELCTGLDANDWVRKPGVGKLSLIEHVWHMLDMERDVFGARMRQVLAEDDPRLEPLDVEEHGVREEGLAAGTLDEILSDWGAARAENLALVESTTDADWARPLHHPQIGRATFLDVALRWSRHDADHLRQIEIIVLNCRERNLP